MLIPYKSHVIFSRDNDIKHQVEGVLFHIILHLKIFPRNRVGFISQYDSQIPKVNADGSRACNP